MAGSITGIGYEGLDQDGLISKLRLRGVHTLVDVRLNPISRKRGLSKTSLRERLTSESISYIHLPALGNPRDNREGFAQVSGGSAASARNRFNAILQTQAAQDALEHVNSLSLTGPVALMCFESDESHCHRALVIAALEERSAA